MLLNMAVAASVLLLSACAGSTYPVHPLTASTPTEQALLQQHRDVAHINESIGAEKQIFDIFDTTASVARRFQAFIARRFERDLGRNYDPSDWKARKVFLLAAERKKDYLVYAVSIRPTDDGAYYDPLPEELIYRFDKRSGRFLDVVAVPKWQPRG